MARPRDHLGGKAKESEGRGIGERFAGAFVGAFFGFFLGAPLALVLYIFCNEYGIQYRLVGAIVAYCAVFTFLFGDALGDAITGAGRLSRLIDIAQRPDHVYRSDLDPEKRWLGPLVAFVGFTAGLLAVIHHFARWKLPF